MDKRICVQDFGVETSWKETAWRY